MSQAPATRPTLLAIGSEFPPFKVTQEEMYEGLLKKWYEKVPNAERIVKNTRVRSRYFAWDPRVALANGSVPTGDRSEVFEKTVLDVAGRSVGKVLAQVDRSKVGSIAMASCTGYMGPTPEYFIAKQFELTSSIRRTFIGHMGCFAAFNVLKVAMDSLAARPNEHVIINCTEFSSLQFRSDANAEQAVIQALFGDTSASAVIGSAPDGEGVQFIRTHTEQIWGTHELMTWNIKNDGFFMTLSPYVPFVIAENIHAYLEKLLGPEKLSVGDVKHWIIHPGGPKIVEMLGKQLKLTEAQLASTWHVLGEYGNCSSATVMLVLEHMLKADKPQRGEYGVMLAFGPGLTVEGALVRF
ncbi:type III polyketide synthase [Archangium lipolyticum]|uniref:type III polyketide synthase n=1 Tax=Archangium lipolyticum TaxID=2970465 RepID=UPI002149AFE8|nr:type III polyketide synthase [Archangium lipolyticum]